MHTSTIFDDSRQKKGAAKVARLKIPPLGGGGGSYQVGGSMHPTEMMNT